MGRVNACRILLRCEFWKTSGIVGVRPKLFEVSDALAFKTRSYWVVLGLVLASSTFGCHPLGADKPTRVESGLLFTAGQPEFDTFFSEYFAAQTELATAKDAEHALRGELSKKLGVVAGATPQLLVDAVARRAQELAEKKVLLRLDIDGLGADDEADTMVQAAVIGTLEDDARLFIENATLLARQELRMSARLRKLKKKLSRLEAHEQALEPSVEPNFTDKGYAKLEEVKRNLFAAKRALPLMSLRAQDQAEDSEQLVRKLGAAMTTDKEVTRKPEAPLITNVEPQASPKRPRTTGGGPRKPSVAAPSKPKSETPESGSGDFDP